MIDPRDSDIGREVIYIRNGDFGVITSYNDHMVFVRYNGDQGSMGTRRKDLDWLDAKVVADSCRSPDTTSKAIPMQDDDD